MLEQAVERLKGTPQARQVETEVNIAVPARIPETYIEDGRERLRAYKQLTGAQDGASREEAALAVRDRFGPFPAEFRKGFFRLFFFRFRPIPGGICRFDDVIGANLQNACFHKIFI